jgi:hypothetical protein
MAPRPACISNDTAGAASVQATVDDEVHAVE